MAKRLSRTMPTNKTQFKSSEIQSLALIEATITSSYLFHPAATG